MVIVTNRGRDTESREVARGAEQDQLPELSYWQRRWMKILIRILNHSVDEHSHRCNASGPACSECTLIVAAGVFGFPIVSTHVCRQWREIPKSGFALH